MSQVQTHTEPHTQVVSPRNKLAGVVLCVVWCVARVSACAALELRREAKASLSLLQEAVRTPPNH